MRAANSTRRTRFADPMTDIRDDLVAIRKDIGALVGMRVGAATDQARRAFRHATDGARDLAAQARDGAAWAHRELGRTASKRPLTTLAAAAIAGAVCAKLIGWYLRRSSD